MKYLCLFFSALLLAGCLNSNGPEKPLREMAAALTKKDSALFLAQMDMKRFAAAQVNNMTQGDAALRTLDSMGKMLGIGGMDELLDSVVDMGARLDEQFTRGVSTGELELECRTATTPDCPWVAQALQNAQIKELNPNAAVARITTPTNISSWLALSKINDAWKVVGRAALEKQAAQYALSPAPAPAPKQNAPAPQPKADKPQEPTKI